MMNGIHHSPAGPRVGAYALIGHDGRLLVIQDRAHHVGVLPGGTVHSGEPVEHALRRSVLDHLGVSVARADFCAVVEHNTPLKLGPASELAFLFDVTLTTISPLAAAAPRAYRWLGEHELDSLHPNAIRNRLRDGSLSIDTPWWGWTP